VRYRPRLDAAKRERLFKRWHKAVERSKGWALEDEGGE
jgi:glycerol kinase